MNKKSTLKETKVRIGEQTFDRVNIDSINIVHELKRTTGSVPYDKERLLDIYKLTHYPAIHKNYGNLLKKDEVFVLA